MKNTVYMVLLSLCCTLAFAAGDPEKGKQHYVLCTACHGPNAEGNPQLNAPINAGQNVWYVVRQLKNFRAGIRGADPKDTFGMQMRPMAMSLPNEQAIEDVAAYVYSLKVENPSQTVTGNVEAGRKAYEPCAACHGPRGEGARSLNAPRLANQYDWYLVRQINNFKQGIRGAHNKDIYGSQMRPMAQLLATDEQVNDVVAFIASIKLDDTTE